MDSYGIVNSTSKIIIINRYKSTISIVDSNRVKWEMDYNPKVYNQKFNPVEFRL